ncbi:MULTISPECIES: acyl-CoA dehydrogenase family protein [Pseudomonas]|uniref:Acyl-CoA/acyl-ACP dehydrogenase n=1 Tax=Serpens gallinarum TaxID=2763075 RepID=A0ABR8TSI5_9PSED|nr:MULTISPECIES: acyl-CoA dehydrogenase family protein [Pseudomonas]MBD7978741.1 acyl-CoA/acyl-ACP dehydrogenase [Serpens gallinarum]MBF0676583.1 acyl-CoA/acyl-ACP dehydrogenase [Pseudomonas sp.]
MNFIFTDDQLAFREAISRFLMTEAAPEMLRDIWETDAGRSPDLRGKIAEQGLTALSVPEECGGLGMDDIAWALMTQELGYYAIPDSLADTAYVAVGLLAALPQSEQRDAWLAQIAEGSVRVAVGHPVNPWVADAGLADWLLLAHQDEVHMVPRNQVSVQGNASIDASRRLYTVTWTPGSATRVAEAQSGRALWAESLNRGALSVAGQLIGLAQRMLDLSVDYVAQRKQFGKPIGSFQAVKHHLADVATQVEFAKPVLYRAAHALAKGEADVDVRISHARLACCEASWLAARHGIQVHGAMGYTWEVDLQMFMKRAWALDNAWGDRALHKTRVEQHLLGAALLPGNTFEE